jgi:hypothetical protein
MHRGVWYWGVVLKVGWNRAKGDGAKVVYEDRYVEIMQVSKLVELQEKVASNNNRSAYSLACR